MWAEKAPLPVHALHTAVTLGQMIGPLIAQPFISSRNDTNPAGGEQINDQAFKYYTSGNMSASWDQMLHSDLHSQQMAPSPFIFMPYVIVGTFTCLVSIVFFIFSRMQIPSEFLSTETTPRTLKQILNPATCADGNILYATFMLICIFLVYLAYVSTNNSMNIFLYPIAMETHLNFTKTSASLLMTTYFAASTAGRFFWGLLSHFIPITVILLLELAFEVGCYTSLASIGLNSLPALWTLACTSAFFMTPVYPTVMAWADRYIKVTGAVVAIIDIGIGSGTFTSSWMSGVIYQRMGAQAFFYWVFACACSLCFILLIMQIVGSIHGDRYEKEEISTSSNNAETVDEKSPLINE